jgi:hypothetical protein
MAMKETAADAMLVVSALKKTRDEQMPADNADGSLKMPL